MQLVSQYFGRRRDKCVTYTIARCITTSNGQNSCEKFAKAVEESWNFALFSAAVIASCFIEVFYLCAVCNTAQCFINLSHRFREDYRTSCVTDYPV